jgi:alkaline phosphatase
MRRFHLHPVIAAAAVLALLAPAAFAADPVDNVIILIPDGCDTDIQTLARWVKGEPLAIDSLISGSVATWIADSVITDSASAATAFATGHKTSNGFLAVGPRPEGVLSNLPAPPTEIQYKPFATVLEGAKLAGKATGLIATSRITHATPAGFAAHIHDRNLDNQIMEHLVYQNIDVVFGGGNRHLLPISMGGKRTDNENLRWALHTRGYQLIDASWGLASAGSSKVWGMFASSHMQADIDRAEFAPNEPSLAEMTAKAIETLDNLSPDGFFLMVEGSQVDWAGHANDPIYMVTDFLAFDAAVEVALDFASDPANGRTLVLAFPDHNTGGFAIGNYSTPYTSLKIEDVVGPLEGMRITGYGLATKIGSDTSIANIQANLLEWWGLDVAAEDVEDIIALTGQGVTLDYAIPTIVSERYTDFGWNTFGHNGGDVPLWSYGPDRPVGHVDNTELARIVADAFGFDLGIVDTLLFQDVTEHFPSAVLDETDPENPLVKIGSCSLPISKDIVKLPSLGINIQMPGITVYAPMTGKIYAPMLAIALIEAVEGGSANAQTLAGLSMPELAQALGVDHGRILAPRAEIE